MRGISWLAEDLLVSQEDLCSMALLRYIHTIYIGYISDNDFISVGLNPLTYAIYAIPVRFLCTYIYIAAEARKHKSASFSLQMIERYYWYEWTLENFTLTFKTTWFRLQNSPPKMLKNRNSNLWYTLKLVKTSVALEFWAGWHNILSAMFYIKWTVRENALPVNLRRRGSARGCGCGWCRLSEVSTRIIGSHQITPRRCPAARVARAGGGGRRISKGMKLRLIHRMIILITSFWIWTRGRSTWGDTCN
jgi:hypothetical protein